MSTGVIILLIVVAVALVAAVVARSVAARGAGGGRGLKRRFGPEYDRAVARHDGDTKAAEHELEERVKRHGSLREQPLESSARERYMVRWTAVQEQFVDSPRDAVVEADRLIAEVAGARGFPDGSRHDEQLDALSVHHAHHVHGYRRVHRAAHAPTNGSGAGPAAGTEELREALVEARALFQDLTAPDRGDEKALARGKSAPQEKTEKAEKAGKAEEAPAATRTDTNTDSSRGRTHAPWALNRRHVKGS
ncbi:hypothetical protein OOK29_03040 [Streptomyces phaeochromogenes]|uniref:hypothetical protein n=1 Tax=Streptomyces phaeochromogenes TaxID=1923 RepID=UPI0022502C4C|nr:hypothetical protein [Streptomyces phaeochromogenes]MCX5597104.1 hypothetical protein [Streptomyces phaeochromogenes]WRZ32620.1 hypothetical protein OG931_35280 [Streptomyces phaeochromogenes]